MNVHSKRLTPAMGQAKDRLLKSDFTVAYDLGFEYPQYFSRLFKKKTGLTPTQYREQYN